MMKCLSTAGMLVSLALSLAELAAAKRPRDQPVLYEISTRPWLYTLAQSGVPAFCGQYVCLKDVPRREWQALADDHVDMVWLMGLWQLGSYALERDRDAPALERFRHDLPDLTGSDVIGSPYSIWNYSVHADIGTAADLQLVRRTLHELGMTLMVDFVPNHAAVDSVDVREHPGFFIQRPAAGDFPGAWWLEYRGTSFAFGRGPYDGPWLDTLNYNYWSPEARAAMARSLLAVAAQADAIRCDMTMLILNEVIERTWGEVMRAGGFSRPKEEFWKVAIDAVRTRYPDTFFLAEAYDYGFTSPPEKPLLQTLGFNAVYDKSVLDNLETQDGLTSYISAQSPAFLARTAHFVENHDEKRSAFALGGPQQAFVGAVVAATLPGTRLFYFGELDGLTNRLAVQLRRAPAEQSDPALHRQYTTLLGVLADEVFHSGAWTYIQASPAQGGRQLCAWRWASASGATKRLVVANPGDEALAGRVPVEDAGAEGGPDGLALRELLTGAVSEQSAVELRSSGLQVALGPWSAQIFAYEVEAGHLLPNLILQILDT